MKLRYAFVAAIAVCVSAQAVAEDACSDVLKIGFREYVSKDISMDKIENTLHSACQASGSSENTSAEAAFKGIPLGFSQKKAAYQRACTLDLRNTTTSVREKFWSDTLSPLLGQAINAWAACNLSKRSNDKGPQIVFETYELQKNGEASIKLHVKPAYADPNHLPVWRLFAFSPPGRVSCDNAPPINSPVKDTFISCTQLGGPRQFASLSAEVSVFGAIQPSLRVPNEEPKCEPGCESCEWHDRKSVCTSYAFHNRDKGEGDHITIGLNNSVDFSCRGMPAGRKVVINADISFRPAAPPNQYASWNGGWILYVGESATVLRVEQPTTDGSARRNATINASTGASGSVSVRLLNNDITVQTPTQRTSAGFLVDDSTVTCRLVP